MPKSLPSVSVLLKDIIYLNERSWNVKSLGLKTLQRGESILRVDVLSFRNSGNGLTLFIARIGAVVAPFMLYAVSKQFIFMKKYLQGSRRQV